MAPVLATTRRSVFCVKDLTPRISLTSNPFPSDLSFYPFENWPPPFPFSFLLAIDRMERFVFGPLHPASDMFLFSFPDPSSVPPFSPPPFLIFSFLPKVLFSQRKPRKIGEAKPRSFFPLESDTPLQTHSAGLTPPLFRISLSFPFFSFISDEWITFLP